MLTWIITIKVKASGTILWGGYKVKNRIIRKVIYCIFLISAFFLFFSALHLFDESFPLFGCFSSIIVAVPFIVLGFTHSVVIALISLAVVFLSSVIGIHLSKNKTLFILIPIGWFVIEFVLSIVIIDSNKNITADVLVSLLMVVYVYLRIKENEMFQGGASVPP